MFSAILFRTFVSGRTSTSRLPGAEITIERLTKIVDRSSTNQGARNVRPANRRSAGFVHHHLHIHFEAECAQLIDDSRRAKVSPRSQCLELCFEKSESRNMQSEQMNFAIAVVRAELYTWNNTHAQCFAGNGRER